MAATAGYSCIKQNTLTHYYLHGEYVKADAVPKKIRDELRCAAPTYKPIGTSTSYSCEEVGQPPRRQYYADGRKIGPTEVPEGLKGIHCKVEEPKQELRRSPRRKSPPKKPQRPPPQPKRQSPARKKSPPKKSPPKRRTPKLAPAAAAPKPLSASKAKRAPRKVSASDVAAIPAPPKPKSRSRSKKKPAAKPGPVELDVIAQNKPLPPAPRRKAS